MDEAVAQHQAQSAPWIPTLGLGGQELGQRSQRGEAEGVVAGRGRQESSGASICYGSPAIYARSAGSGSSEVGLGNLKPYGP